MKLHDKIPFRTLGALILAQSIAAQTLTLGYRGHDGASAETARMPVLATGNLVGKLTIETTERELEFTAAYYSNNGNLLFSEAGSPDARAWFVFRAQDRRLYPDANPMQFPITLPVGEQGGAQLPVGNFTLRVWVGRPGAMRYDPTTGVPVAGFTGTATAPVTVDPVPYAVYVPSPRNLAIGSKVEMRILTDRAVSRNVTFRVLANDLLGSVSATQVMIPRGKTCSPGFILSVTSSNAEGQIVVRDDAGGEYRTSMLRTQPQGTQALGPNEDEPGIDSFAYCSKRAKWRHFGENEQVCGSCATNPSSPVACQVPPGQSHGVYEKAECTWNFTDDCELFREQHNGVQTYSASNTYNQSCGSTQWKIDLTGELTGTIGGIVGQIGGNITAAGTITKYQKCCLVRHGPLATVSLVQCRTID
jgi:hypothetical protein